RAAPECIPPRTPPRSMPPWQSPAFADHGPLTQKADSSPLASAPKPPVSPPGLLFQSAAALRASPSTPRCPAPRPAPCESQSRVFVAPPCTTSRHTTQSQPAASLENQTPLTSSLSSARSSTNC